MYKIIAKAKNGAAALKTYFLFAIGKSDYGRWRDINRLLPDWDTRTEQIGALISPGASVIEFGAGRMALRSYLPAGCSYTPSDVVYRGEGTIICDLNAKELPALVHYDVAVFSGVLEYVNDIPRLASYLSKSVNEVIASYAVLELNRTGRRASGWVNDYTEAELTNIFHNEGFLCASRERWRNQQVYCFHKKPGKDMPSPNVSFDAFGNRRCE